MTLSFVLRWDMGIECGIVMAASFLAIGAIALLARGRSIFWPETVAVGAFAIAWLVKGQTVLKDRLRSACR